MFCTPIVVMHISGVPSSCHSIENHALSIDGAEPLNDEGVVAAYLLNASAMGVSKANASTDPIRSKEAIMTLKRLGAEIAYRVGRPRPAKAC
eukprot:6198823-Pleurochrysis_carterae.AAC.8